MLPALGWKALRDSSPSGCEGDYDTGDSQVFQCSTITESTICMYRTQYSPTLKTYMLFKQLIERNTYLIVVRSKILR